MYNRFRLITSGTLFLFAVYCLIWNPELPFSFPRWVYITAAVYFAVFPVKDMISPACGHHYKSRQYARCFRPAPGCDRAALLRKKRTYDRRAAAAMAFWLLFLGAAGTLYYFGAIGKEWIFFLFALANFGVYFAVFFWCPFYAIFIRPGCCMECRIYNWDSFFAYSFLVFLPSVYTLPLVFLGVLSLVKWEIAHARHPERFYKISNCALQCTSCDMEACKRGKKKFFSTEFKEDATWTR